MESTQLFNDGISLGGKEERTEWDITAKKSIIEKPVLQSWHRFLAFTIFMMIGTINLINYNTVLSVNGIYTELVSEGLYSVTDLVVTCYSIVTLFSTGLLICYNVSSPRYTFAGICVSFMALITYAVGIYIRWSITMYLFHVAAVLMALGSALIGCSGFGFANRILEGYSGAMSSGLGFSGLFATFIWYTIQRYVTDTSKALKILFIVLICFYVIVTTLFIYFVHLPFVKHDLQVTKKNPDLEVNDINESKTKTFKDTFKQCKWYSISLFSNFFITLFVFPNFVPVYSDPKNEFLYVAIFIIGDFIGRYLPNIKAIRLKQKAILVFTFCRAKFIPVFFILVLTSLKSHETTRKVSILLLGITNGFSATNLLILNGKCVVRPKEQAMVGSIGLMGIQLGISCGQVVSLFITRRLLPSNKV